MIQPLPDLTPAWSLTTLSLLSHIGLLAVPFVRCNLQLFPWLTPRSLRFSSHVTSERSSLTLFHILKFWNHLVCYCHLSSCLSFPTKLKALDGLYTQCPAHKWVLRSLSNELYTCLPSLLSELLACAYLHQGPTHLPPNLQVKGLSCHSRHSFHSVDSALLPGFELPTFFYIATPVFLSLVFSFSKWACPLLFSQQTFIEHL